MDISQFDERLTAIESRLSALESRPRPKPAAPVADDWDDPFGTPKSSRPASPAPQRFAKASVYDAPTSHNWLGIVAILCFVLAAGLIIKLSIDSGWLTPIRQLGLAALLGLCLIGTGLALPEKDKDYASYLPGGGVIVLYLTAFAAHRYYGLIPFEAAIGLVACVSGLCIWLYDAIRHEIYPVTAAVGSYCAPIVLGLHAESTFALDYSLICSVAFATISLWLESRLLTIISAYLAILTTALIGAELHQDKFLAIVLALHFLIFSAGTWVHSHQTRIALTAAEAWAFFPVLLIFYAAEYSTIDRIDPMMAPYLALLFAGILIGLYLSAKRFFADEKSLASRSLILSFATLVCFHALYLKLLPDDVRPWLFVAILTGMAFMPRRLVSAVRNQAFLIPALALLVIVVIEYLTIATHMLQGLDASWLTVGFAGIAAMWVALLRPNGLIERDSTGHALLGAAHVLAILALYRLTTGHGALAVSASWLFYAVGVIVVGYVRRDEIMTKSALFVLAFAAAKALLFDAAAAATPIRILCVLLTGAVLYSCGLFMRRVGEWKEPRVK